jgi:hypothetical protein
VGADLSGSSLTAESRGSQISVPSAGIVTLTLDGWTGGIALLRRIGHRPKAQGVKLLDGRLVHGLSLWLDRKADRQW